MERLNRQGEGVVPRITALLIIVALAAVATLWSLSPTGSSGETPFAVFLAVDLLSFAMLSYIYRGSKSGEGVNRLPLIVGCAFISALLFLGFLA